MASKQNCIEWLGEINQTINRAVDQGAKPEAIKLLKRSRGYFTEGVDNENRDERDYAYEMGKSVYSNSRDYWAG